MDKKEKTEKLLRVIKDYKSHSNKDLVFAMDIIRDDFEKTKTALINLTHNLDKLEETYNLILNEYESRNNKKEI